MYSSSFHSGFQPDSFRSSPYNLTLSLSIISSIGFCSWWFFHVFFFSTANNLFFSLLSTSDITTLSLPTTLIQVYQKLARRAKKTRQTGTILTLRLPNAVCRHLIKNDIKSSTLIIRSPGSHTGGEWGRGWTRSNGILLWTFHIFLGYQHESTLPNENVFPFSLHRIRTSLTENKSNVNKGKHRMCLLFRGREGGGRFNGTTQSKHHHPRTNKLRHHVGERTSPQIQGLMWSVEKQTGMCVTTALLVMEQIVMSGGGGHHSTEQKQNNNFQCEGAETWWTGWNKEGTTLN